MLARVASGFAASALQRRVILVGPLLALALAGSGPATERSALAPSPSASASTTDPLDATKRAILRAYEAEAVYKVDNLVYAAAVGDELEALKLEEPSVAWGTTVIVQFPNEEAIGAEVVILRAPIPGGGSLCLCEVGEVEDAGLYYARVAGSAKCPPFKPGMPGWVKDDREAGWAG
jgi:hypothetical protein